MRYLLAVDAGTTSFKAVLFDEKGNEHASARKEYRLLTPDKDIVEFGPEDYWRICCETVREVVEKAGESKPVEALAIDSQGETLVCIDTYGSPLRNAIVWLDNRAVHEAGIIEDEFGVQSVFETTGQPEVEATWPASKILWLKRNEPDVFRKTRSFLLLEDYLIFRMTGSCTGEKTLWSSSIMWDISRDAWWGDMLDMIGISADTLPQMQDSGTVAGRITEEAAGESGLKSGIPVVTGALDQIAGMIGAGNLEPGTVTETTGSALAMCATVDRMPPYDPSIKIPCHLHACSGRYVLLSWATTAGMVLKWFSDNFYSSEKKQSGKTGESIYELMGNDASGVPAGSDGLVMLPHLSGAACPEFNPRASGVFFGITLKHTRPHFVRAIMESVGCMVKRNLCMIEETGIYADRITALGGGAASPLWNSIKADITGKPVATLKSPETACLGAAMLAGTGIGLFDSLESACSGIVQEDRLFTPDKHNEKIYAEVYRKYFSLYDSLEELF